MSAECCPISQVESIDCRFIEDIACGLFVVYVCIICPVELRPRFRLSCSLPVDFTDGMAEKDYAPLSAACVRALSDKLYDKRKAAALEIEK